MARVNNVETAIGHHQGFTAGTGFFHQLQQAVFVKNTGTEMIFLAQFMAQFFGCYGGGTRLPTTTPAAVLASTVACTSGVPAASAAASTEITVSPAPVTSNTPGAGGLMEGFLIALDQRHAFFRCG